MRDFSDDISALRKRLDEAAGYLKVEELRARRPQLETEASRPDLWDDPTQARKVTGELSSVVDDLERYDTLASRIDDLETLFELGRDEDDDSVEGELDAALTSLRADFGELELRSLFTGEYDDRDALCEVHVGRGRHRRPGLGEMLLRMYLRWAERRGFDVELDDVHRGSGGRPARRRRSS